MPLVYTGPPDVVEDLESVYRGALPGDIASTGRALDEARVFAVMVAMGEGVGAGWAREARLSTSSGLWLDQHARDRDLGRQLGEDDPTLRSRLKTGPKAVTYGPIYDAIAAIVHGADPDAVFYLLRIPVDVGAFVGTDCFCGADSRITPRRPRVTIALIPAALASIETSVLEALRSKMPAGHGFKVELFS